MHERIVEASRKLRMDMERLLPSRSEQQERIERLIELAGRNDKADARQS